MLASGEGEQGSLVMVGGIWGEIEGGSRMRDKGPGVMGETTRGVSRAIDTELELDWAVAGEMDLKSFLDECSGARSESVHRIYLAQ